MAERVLDTAVALGATYADCRHVQRRSEEIRVKNGIVVSVTIGEDEGCGVRVIADGAWGFAATDRLDADSLDRTAALAVRCARASARHSPSSVALAPQAPAR